MAVRAFVFLLCLGFIQAKLLNLSCKQVRQFVDGHNSRRLMLARGEVEDQPAASSMKVMVWDNELAAKAAKWASYNRFQHNPDRTVGSGRFRTGENLYIFYTTRKDDKLNVEDALKSWWDEYKQFTYKEIESSDFSSSAAIGHYTQMAWEDSTRVGCGVSQYQDGQWYKTLVVCNYGPAGNYIGQYPYPTESGWSADRLTCDGDCSQRYGNQC